MGTVSCMSNPSHDRDPLALAPVTPNDLARLRKARGFTVRGLAHAAHIGRNQVSRIELHLVDPKATTMTAIAVALGLPLDAIWPTARLAAQARQDAVAVPGEALGTPEASVRPAVDNPGSRAAALVAIDQESNDAAF